RRMHFWTRHYGIKQLTKTIINSRYRFFYWRFDYDESPITINILNMKSPKTRSLFTNTNENKAIPYDHLKTIKHLHMKHLKFLLVGILLGIVLVKSEAVS